MSVVYSYQADLWCEACGKDICAALAKEYKVPANPEDESSFDSDDYPKRAGPEVDQSADTVQHCAAGQDCINAVDPGGDWGLVGAWLENPLTEDGKKEVEKSINEKPHDPLMKLWAEWYDIEPDWLPIEPEEGDYVTNDYMEWGDHGTGKVLIVIGSDPHEEDTDGKPVWVGFVKLHMDKQEFWPNCWYLGERGDWNLLDLETGGYLTEESRKAKKR